MVQILATYNEELQGDPIIQVSQKLVSTDFLHNSTIKRLNSLLVGEIRRTVPIVDCQVKY